MPERRTAHRMPVRIQAQCRGESGLGPALVENLSRSGLFFWADHEPPAGAYLQLTLNLKDCPVTVTVEVVRVDSSARGNGIAVRFLNLDVLARRELANYMIERNYQALA